MAAGPYHDTWKTLWEMGIQIPVVDAHTHVQDDLSRFDQQLARENLAGTQSTVGRHSAEIIEQGIRAGRLTRRTMLDATHALFYSWFAALAEGGGGRLDEAIAECVANTERERRDASRFLLRQLHDSRFTEYAEWLRSMFRLYPGVPKDRDPLDPAGFDAVCDAVAARRGDPSFAEEILRSNRIQA